MSYIEPSNYLPINKKFRHQFFDFSLKEDSINGDCLSEGFHHLTFPLQAICKYSSSRLNRPGCTFNKELFYHASFLVESSTDGLLAAYLIPAINASLRLPLMVC